MTREIRYVTKRGALIIAVVLCPFAISMLLAGAQSVAPLKPELWVGGNTNAPLKIEVFSDFQCPYCRTFYMETVKPLIADFTKEKKIDKIYIVYHDFPLDGHPFSRKAASYALAAGRLGRDVRLKVTDALYNDQAQWSTDGNLDPTLLKVLSAAELARVKQLAADPAVEQVLQAEVALGKSRNITSTPTWFLVTEAGRLERVDRQLDYAIVKGRLDQLAK